MTWAVLFLRCRFEDAAELATAALASVFHVDLEAQTLIKLKCISKTLHSLQVEPTFACEIVDWKQKFALCGENAPRCMYEDYRDLSLHP